MTASSSIKDAFALSRSLFNLLPPAKKTSSMVSLAYIATVILGTAGYGLHSVYEKFTNAPAAAQSSSQLLHTPNP